MVRDLLFSVAVRHAAGMWCVLGALAGCGPSDLGQDELDVKVDTATELAWQQYLANLEFAKRYTARCDAPAGADRRVLITGFGRFQSNAYNATGGMVSELLEELDYPETSAPPAGAVDEPAPQTAVAQGIIELPGAGKVAVCAMVLPVFWDLAPVLVAREMAAFRPELVLMNGIAGWRQEIWLELGAVNQAKRLEDGSNNLSPAEDPAPLLPDAPASEYARPNLASWRSVRGALTEALALHGDVTRDGVRLRDVVQGALFAGYPRSSNTYLCNNTTYTVGYVMDHFDTPVRLMEASHVWDADVDAGIDLTLEVDLSAVPRLFMHWPSDLRREHLVAGTALLRAAVDAQLMQVGERTLSELPTRGDNEMADLQPTESLAPPATP